MRTLKLQLTQLQEGKGSETDSEDSEDDEVDDLPLPAPHRMGPRTSVSAEAFGVWNKKAAFKPAFYAKTP